jgi:hypothetical protein
MATDYVQIPKGINLQPLTSAVSVEGDVGFNGSTHKLEIRDNSATRSVVTEDGTATLSNKTITASVIGAGTSLATGSSTARTLNSRAADVVNVKDFGAVGDGSTDDTTAIQAAVDYSLGLAQPLPIFLPGKHLVSASINVDQAVNTATSEFVFFAEGGDCGFYVTGGSFPIITSSISMTTAPVSERVTFHGVHFEASTTSTGCYAISPKMYRITFVNCDFVKLQCMYSPTVYIQSIHFRNCKVRNCGGYFLKTDGGSYDVSFEGCQFEYNNHIFYSVDSTNGTQGMRFINCLSESNTGSTLILTGCTGVTIGWNYFEFNATEDIKLNGGSMANLSVSIIGNKFYNPGLTLVKWGTTSYGYSEGNNASGNLHVGVSNVTQLISIGDTASTISDVTLSTTIGPGIQTNGSISTGGTLRSTGSNAAASGSGVEIDYGSVAANTGRLFAFDRGAGARKDMVVDGATVAFYSAGAERLRVQGDGTLRFSSVAGSTVPTNSSGAMGSYQTGTKYVVWYNDAGTVRYKYLNMAGTGVTWVHTTTAP